jgi:hypothetical protein
LNIHPAILVRDLDLRVILLVVGLRQMVFMLHLSGRRIGFNLDQWGR